MILAKKLWSVFTDDMNSCYFTGSPYVQRHHIFRGNNKARSEKYGFIIPLRHDLHLYSDKAVHENKEFDLKLKNMAKDYYVEHYGTEEEFAKEFGVRTFRRDE